MIEKYSDLVLRNNRDRAECVKALCVISKKEFLIDKLNFQNLMMDLKKAVGTRFQDFSFTEPKADKTKKNFKLN